LASALFKISVGDFGCGVEMPNERATVAKNDLNVAKNDRIIDASIVLPNNSRNFLSWCLVHAEQK
jgi:hypothetical protein